MEAAAARYGLARAGRRPSWHNFCGWPGADEADRRPRSALDGEEVPRAFEPARERAENQGSAEPVGASEDRFEAFGCGVEHRRRFARGVLYRQRPGWICVAEAACEADRLSVSGMAACGDPEWEPDLVLIEQHAVRGSRQRGHTRRRPSEQS